MEDFYVYIETAKATMELKGVSFFNSNEFLLNRSVPLEQVFFFLKRKESQSPVAKLSLCTLADEAVSQWKSPYGSIEWDPSINLSNLVGFIKRITTWLIENQHQSFKILSYPDCYINNPDFVDPCFEKSNIRKQTTDINQFIEIKNSEFESIISYSEKMRLNKSMKLGLHSQQSSVSELHEAYALLLSLRQRKGIPISMDFESLERMFQIHPDHYFLFTVKDGSKIVAMAVSIIVNDSILYDFYHADHDDYQSLSPTIMLIEEIYNFCRMKKIRILDLGISSLDGVKNEGLYRFKKNLGAKECSKNTFKWN